MPGPVTSTESQRRPGRATPTVRRRVVELAGPQGIERALDRVPLVSLIVLQTGIELNLDPQIPKRRRGAVRERDREHGLFADHGPIGAGDANLDRRPGRAGGRGPDISLCRRRRTASAPDGGVGMYDGDLIPSVGGGAPAGGPPIAVPGVPPGINPSAVVAAGRQTAAFAAPANGELGTQGTAAVLAGAAHSRTSGAKTCSPEGSSPDLPPTHPAKAARNSPSM